MQLEHIRLAASATGACLALFCSIPTSSTAQTLHYRAYHVDTDSTLWLFAVDWPTLRAGFGEVSWRSESGDSHTERYRVEPDGNTLEWTVSFAERLTEYRGVRVGDRLTVTGLVDGDSVADAHDLDERPLFFNVALGLGAFIDTGSTEVTFWAYRPDKRSVIRMRARHEGTDTISVQGERTPAVRVRFGPTGWRGLFYSRRFWFRPSDGALVRTDEEDGRVTELVGSS